MKKLKLKDIANIQMGLVLSRAGAKQLELIKQDVAEKVSQINAYNYSVITLRSINDYGNLDSSQCDNFISKGKLTDRYLTLKNDILVRLFTPIKSCLITEEDTNIVIPSQFAVVRIKEQFLNKILPEYLQLVMQNNDFTNQIQKIEEGFQLRSIRTSSIENVEINIPSIENQLKFIAISKLMKRKEELLSELSDQQKKQNSIILEKLIKGEI